MMREMGIKKGPWTSEEDEILAKYITREGEGRWRTLPKRAGLMRCGKSCRLRWMNYLRPSVKRGRIAPDEEDLILRLHRLLGNRWSLIAGRIPGRTDNEIKNYWNTHLSKKLISQGIDPRNHKPLKLNPSSSLSPQVVDAHDNNIPAPNSSNPNPNFCGLEEVETGCIVVPHKSNLEVTNQMMSMHQNPVAAHVNSTTIQDLQMSSHEGLLMINNNEGEGEEEDGIVGYCNDEMFSSFLNSLINDDVLAINHQQQLPLNNAFAPPSSASYSQVSSSVLTTFNNGNNVWEEDTGRAPIYDNGCLGDVLKHQKT